jgi:hypothetical protein
MRVRIRVPAQAMTLDAQHLVMQARDQAARTTQTERLHQQVPCVWVHKRYGKHCVMDAGEQKRGCPLSVCVACAAYTKPGVALSSPCSHVHK